MALASSIVVAHTLDHTLIRGRNNDFRPGVPTFTVETRPDGKRVLVRVADLKALFFVRSLDGKPDHVQSNEYDDGPKVGRRVWVVFADGEELAGRALSVKPENDGFFLFPSDPKSNLERAWIVVSNTKSVLFDREATDASRDYVSPSAASSGAHLAPDQWDEMLGLRCDSAARDKSSPAKQRRKASDIFLGDW